MKASELIKRLQELIEEYGDHSVVYLDDFEVVRIEYSYEEDVDPMEVFVIE